MTRYISQFEEEFNNSNAAMQLAARISRDLASDVSKIANHDRLMRHYYGIHDAHSKGVGCEEIAQHLSKPVEYVEDCVQLVTQLEYSKRTGNAIICKFPEE